MHTIPDHFALIEAIQHDYRTEAKHYRRNRAAAETIPLDRGRTGRRSIRILLPHRAPSTT